MMIVEPGVMLIGNGEERTEVQAARQLAAWMEAEGWEVRIEPIPGHFVHIDVLVSILAPKLAAVCVESASGGLVAWLRGKGFEILEVSDRGRLQARRQRDLARRRPGALDRAARRSSTSSCARSGSRSSTRTSSMFTMGGGGAHCLAQALRPRPGLSSMAAAAAIDAGAGDRRPARARPADRRRATAPSGCAGDRAGARRASSSASSWPRSASSPRSTRPATCGRGSRVATASARRSRSARTSTRSPTAAGSTARSA